MARWVGKEQRGEERRGEDAGSCPKKKRREKNQADLDLALFSKIINSQKKRLQERAFRRIFLNNSIYTTWVAGSDVEVDQKKATHIYYVTPTSIIIDFEPQACGADTISIRENQF